MKKLSLIMLVACKSFRRAQVVICFALIVLLYAPVATAANFGNEAVGLPEFQKERIPHYEGFKLRFLPDGYPGKYLEKYDLVVPHPILGSYAILDYLLLYENTKDQKYLSAALKVADAAINRMEYLPKHDALVFWYEVEFKLSHSPKRYYSGLTQARYLLGMVTLSKLTGNPKYREAADRMFNSLLIPVEEDGVLLSTPYGQMIEEHPLDIPTYILNGWASGIWEVYKYAKETDRLEAFEFVETNLDTMEKMLPLFDIPDLQNTRYQLTGFNYTRASFTKTNNCTVTSFKTKIDERLYDSIEDEKNRWNNYIVKKDFDEEGFPAGNRVTMNTVYSFINDSQSLQITLQCKSSDKLKLHTSNGDYNPMLAAMPAERWLYIGEQELNSGENQLEFKIDNSDIRLIAWPTNFASAKGKTKGNAYHFIHYKRLEDFQKIRKNNVVFKHYAEKWKEYTKSWNTVDAILKGKVDISE